MTTTIKQSKLSQLVTALSNGERLTASQIESRFNIANPSATVSDLRLRHGYAIYANKRKTAGTTLTEYRLGRPPRAVVAAGYRALAST